jgi:hypothetical protein
MQYRVFTLVAPLLLGLSAYPPAAAKPPGGAVTLARAGETTVFAFQTKSGKAAALCRGPKGAYLVYRFGTAAKVELQYPAKLDASSWQKFTYWSYSRGGGASNEGVESSQLAFKNGGIEYTLSDETRAVYDKNHEEDYRRGVGIDVKVKGKTISITGIAATAVGNLSAVKNDGKVKIDEEM